MAVKLRLRRMGRKKRPFYRIVAADARSPRDGKFIEEVGYYNPLNHPATVELDKDRAMYWLGVGAIPTDTVKNLLSREGLILRFDLQKQGVPEEKIEEEMKKWEALQVAKAQRLEQEKAAKVKTKAETEKAAAEPVEEAPVEESPAEETESTEE